MTDDIDIDTDGQAERNALALTMGVAAAVAGVAACFAGSVVANAGPPETPFDEYCRDCDEGMEAASEGGGVTLSPEAGPSHRWRQSVAAGRTASRSR